MSPVGTSAYNVVISGTMPSGAGDPPELLSFGYSFGGTNATMTIVVWQPLGRVRFKCVATVGDDKTSAWTTVGLSSTVVIVEDVSIGTEYTMYYQIDPEPDYSGWDEEAWRIIVASEDPNLPTWTQPIKNDPYNGEWEPDAL